MDKIRFYNIVWMKRDLRIQDHAPLFAAESTALPYWIIHLIEPKIIRHNDTSLRHLQFSYGSVSAINQHFNQEFNNRENLIHILYADAVSVFDYLCSQYRIQSVFSYQEIGCLHTWERDKSIGALLKKKGVQWKEYHTNGIIRGKSFTSDWRKQWYQTMQSPILRSNTQYAIKQFPTTIFNFPNRVSKKISTYPKMFQLPGEPYAWKRLIDFTENYITQYQKNISKPYDSRTSCSRLSPYLSFGNISIKQVYQFLTLHPNYSKYKRIFNSVIDRLRWHCHFIQKFEWESSYEFHCINPGYETLSFENNDELLELWKLGQTGIPLVDASMRALHNTGWINFRMRAMLVSFLCHYLDQDWRRGVYHLAKLFLDYEPGIHYPQFQMQAGVTGVNTIRIYNPHKQFLDNDNHGAFIKNWIPELRGIPSNYVGKPHEITPMEKIWLSQENIQYPTPIIDLETSHRATRKKLWGHRKNKDVVYWNKKIIKKFFGNKNIDLTPSKENVLEMG